MSHQPPSYASAAEASRIYFLPNLMTGGNLFCGFFAIIRCIEAKFAAQVEAVYTDGLLDPLAELMRGTPAQLYEQAVWFILAAVVFDSLDGRLARLGGKESLFGKEFDSIADIVSFGLAPALLVFFFILNPSEQYPVFRQLGWMIGFVYLACAAIRLARFNVITSPLLKPDERLPKSDFLGLPVPAAAGTIGSLVMVLNRVAEVKWLPLILPFLLLLIALMMVSTVHYPSFKNIDWRTEIRPRTLIAVLIGGYLVWEFHFFAVALLFISYIFYGLWRHAFRSHKARRARGILSE